MARTVPATIAPDAPAGPTTDLVVRARGGDRDAFGALVEEHWSGLVALARGILAGDGEAEDLVQEALLHAWARLWTLRRPERFGAWMRRSVARRCLTRARRRWPREELAELPVHDPPVADRLDAGRLLASLAPRQRAALYLTWIEGRTDLEAARLLGVRPATVRVHRHRGMERLRRMVGEEE